MSRDNEGGGRRSESTDRPTRESEERLVKRLYYNQMEAMAMKEKERMDTLEKQRKSHTRTMSKSNEAKLVKRMYDNQIQLKQAKEEERKAKEEQEMQKTKKQIDGDAMDNRIKHLYEETIERKKANKEELERRLFPVKEFKKMSKKEIAASVERLYTVNWEERDRKLFEKWVYPNDPKMAKISNSAVKDMADRLSTKG